MSEILKIDHLCKYFEKENGDKNEVLKDLSFSVQENEILGIMGSSGCGKTTLLKMIGLLSDASSGDIFLKGESTKSMSERKRSDLRRKEIGFIFQDYMLLETLSVEDNIVLPLLIDGSKDLDVYKKAYEYAEILGITDVLKRFPKTLSGGEKQRVAICRALINNPDIILADEPTGNLDGKFRDKVIEEIVKIKHEFGKTIIIVTHDPYVASFCDRVINL